MARLTDCSLAVFSGADISDRSKLSWQVKAEPTDCVEPEQLWLDSLSAALELGTYAVNPMRSMFHQLMTYYKRLTQQASMAPCVILT